MSLLRRAVYIPNTRPSKWHSLQFVVIALARSVKVWAGVTVPMPAVTFQAESRLATQAIEPIPAHFSVACVVCRLSHSRTLLDGFRGFLVGTLVGSGRLKSRDLTSRDLTKRHQIKQVPEHG